MGNYTICLDVQKSLERQASKKFYSKWSENSRSQIVFRTDIFRKLTLDAPVYLRDYNLPVLICVAKKASVEINLNTEFRSRINLHSH